MKNNKGIKLALITAFVSGVSIFINKFAVGSIQPALVFTGVKNVMVGIIIISIMIMTRRLKELKNLRRKEIGQLMAIGLIGGSLPFYLFFTGLSQSSAINGALIHKSLVLWVAILAIRYLGEKINLNQVIAILILFASNLVIGGFKGFSFNKGELMILVATIFWAVENVMAKKVLRSVSADLVTAARMGLGSMILIIAAMINYPQELLSVVSLTGEQWMWLGLTAISLFAYVKTWYQALKHAPAILVSSILVGSTLVTNLLSAIFITHSWNWQMGIQMGMIGLGLGMLIMSQNNKMKETEAIA